MKTQRHHRILGERSLHPVVIEGHTDSIGRSEYNQSLSEAVRPQYARVLNLWELHPKKCLLLGYGETRPIADNG